MRAARTDLRLSSAALSRRLGKNDNWASDVERGHGSPDPEALVVLARELGRSVAWLVTGEETGRSEFVDAMATYEARLQTRSKHMLLELAERESRLFPVAVDGLDLSDLSDEERDLVLGVPADARSHVLATIRTLRATPAVTAEPASPEAAPRRRASRA